MDSSYAVSFLRKILRLSVFENQAPVANTLPSNMYKLSIFLRLFRLGTSRTRDSTLRRPLLSRSIYILVLLTKYLRKQKSNISLLSKQNQTVLSV